MGLWFLGATVGPLHETHTVPTVGSILFVHAPSAQGTLPSEHRVHRGAVSVERKILQHLGREQGTYRATGRDCVTDVAGKACSEPFQSHHAAHSDTEADEERAGPVPSTKGNVDDEDVPCKGDDEEAKLDSGASQPVCPEEEAVPGTETMAALEEDARV